MTPSRTSATGASLLALVLLLAGCTNAAVSEVPSQSGATSSPSVTPSPTPTPTSSESSANSEQSAGSNSGQSDSGSGNSGSGNSGNDSTEDSAQPEPDAGGSTSAPPASAPTVAVTQQKCLSGKLTITLTANANNEYRKGISAVSLERQNEYNAWISGTATWLGPETGQGNQWTGNLPGNTQNIGKTLRVTATSASGTKTTISAAVTAPC